jgi:hypothetical protein
MVILGPRMTSATVFQPLAGADRAKMAIFDHPQTKEGLNGVAPVLGLGHSFMFHLKCPTILLPNVFVSVI